MIEDEEILDSHVIELADTRPIMMFVPSIGLLNWLGEVPLTPGILMLGFLGLSYTQGGLAYCIWFPFAWGVIAKLITNNYHGITHFQKYIQTGNLLCLTRRRQGGVSVTPFPDMKNKYRGMV